MTIEEKNLKIGAKDNGNVTIADIAEALGISKTTVSRSISGKGRISDATRQKVLDYIQQYNYKPNPYAKGLAQSRTYNIGWVVPGDSSMTSLPFFQRCMLGVGEAATAEDYDILLSSVLGDDISALERAVGNHKVDGFILARTLQNDPCIACLKESGLPFVVIGSTEEEGVVQIDNDHVKACAELTSILIMKGVRRVAYVGGNSNHVVNITRRQGFEKGIEIVAQKPEKILIYVDNDTSIEVERATEDAMRSGIDCIICSDDRITHDVLEALKRNNYSVPEDVKVASFYNSELLSSHQPPITALQYDPKELGRVACRILLDIIEGEEFPVKTLLSYEVVLKGSTV